MAAKVSEPKPRHEGSGAGKDKRTGSPHGRISHRLPNRARIKVKAHRGNADYFHHAKTLVSGYAGVEAVDVNPQAATLVIKHTGPLEDIVARAEQDLLFAIIEGELEESIVFQLLAPAGSLIVLLLWRVLCRG